LIIKKIYNLKKLLHKILKLTGYKLAPIENVSRTRFFIDIDRIQNSYGFSYNSKGFHPFNVLIDEFERDSSLSFEDSIIYRFYKSFQPSTLTEALILDQELICNDFKYPRNFSVFRVNIFPMPWSKHPDRYQQKFEKYSRELSISHEDYLYREAEHHFERTIKTYNSIKKHGFNPEKYSDMSMTHGYIRGVILKKGEDWRFVVLGGQHRIAALKKLKFKSAPVIFQPDEISIVDLEDIANWPVIRSKSYSIKEAEKIFNNFFEDNGTKKAKKLFLI